MYAVIKAGGKQYRVAKDARLVLDFHLGEPGTMVSFDQVLMIGDEGAAPALGAPLVDKAAVFAEVIEIGRHKKIIVFKKKRRANYRRKKGHRQDQTILRILEVSPTGAKPEFTPKEAKEPEPKSAAKPKRKAKAKPENEDKE